MEKEDSASLLNSLKDKIKIVHSRELPLALGCCIYKVPPTLREVNEKVFRPTVVSIGPFHREDKRLEPMQEIKFWHFNKFLERNGEISLEDFIELLKDKEHKIRRYYSETIAMNSNIDFVRMILIDACFIIEFFLAYDSREGLLSERHWPSLEIILDLILLENQVPFFILEDLFNLIFPTGFNNRFSFLEVIFPILVNKFLLANIYPFSNFSSSTDYQVRHFCDLLRTLYLPCHLPPRGARTAMRHLYTVSQLHEAGIKFEAANQDKRVIEVQFSKGVLKIPGITLIGWTETLLVNVVAFEQCHFPHEHYVTDYLVLLNYLIDNRKDVQILVEKRIIETFADNDIMASMVSKHRINVVEININGDYSTLYAGVNEFYDNPCHKHKAIFVREYWSTPWKKASLIGAVVLPLLTFIRTVCSIISLFKK